MHWVFIHRYPAERWGAHAQSSPRRTRMPTTAVLPAMTLRSCVVHCAVLLCMFALRLCAGDGPHAHVVGLTSPDADVGRGEPSPGDDVAG